MQRPFIRQAPLPKGLFCLGGLGPPLRLLHHRLTVQRYAPGRWQAARGGLPDRPKKCHLCGGWFSKRSVTDQLGVSLNKNAFAGV